MRPIKSGPEVALVGMATSLVQRPKAADMDRSRSRRAGRLAIREPEGEGPSADAGEEVALGVATRSSARTSMMLLSSTSPGAMLPAAIRFRSHCAA